MAIRMEASENAAPPESFESHGINEEGGAVAVSDAQKRAKSKYRKESNSLPWGPLAEADA